MAMYERTNTRASDLRARAEQVRAGNATFAATHRAAHIKQGERLSTAPLGDSEELRITWAEYNGRPILSLRAWTIDSSRQWWPAKEKGFAIRRSDLADRAEGVAAAFDRADAFSKAQEGYL